SRFFNTYRHRSYLRIALHKKCKYTNHSAKGAEYDSQGQARSASPLGNRIKSPVALKGRNTCDISAFQASSARAYRTRGDALRACPWLLYFAPLALWPD